MKRNSIQLVVRSQKTPVRVEKLTIPMPNGVDATMKGTKSVVIYDYVLDRGQRRVLEETRELARRHGLRLDVIDLARETLARRILRRMGAVIHGATPIWQPRESWMSECSLGQHGAALCSLPRRIVGVISVSPLSGRDPSRWSFRRPS